MLSFLRVGLCAFLIAEGRAASLDFAVSANLPGGVPIFAADRDGNILIASRLGSYTCPLPTVNAMNTCGPLWIAKLDPRASILCSPRTSVLAMGILRALAPTLRATLSLPPMYKIPTGPRSTRYNPHLMEPATFISPSSRPTARSLSTPPTWAAAAMISRTR